MMQQCLTCSRRNIPPEQVSCPACGSVNLRGYDPAASDAPVPGVHKIPDIWLAGRAGHYEREGVEPAEAVRRAVADWAEQERREAEYKARYDPESDGGEGEDLDREDRARWARAAKLDREGDV